MPESRLTFFVSSTTQDLGSYRDAVADALLTRGIYPEVQKYFAPDYRTVLEILHAKIARCDAVVCLVGLAFGAAPARQDGSPRSYTQIEYDTARALGKPIYLFLSADDCVPDQPPSEDEGDRSLQQVFRREIQAIEHRWELFSRRDQLRERVALLELPVVARRGQLPLRALHPPRVPAFFTGRRLELAQLGEALERRLRCIVAVVGPGGQGKTTLVSHWLQDHLGDDGRFDAVFWCTAYRGGFTFDSFLDASLTYLMEGAFERQRSPRPETESTSSCKCSRHGSRWW